MPKSIAGYNEAVAIGRNAAVKYLNEWKTELARDGVILGRAYQNKQISLVEYNNGRTNLNKRTEQLNACIQSINKRFGDKK